MSSNYYFHKWKTVISNLKALVLFDQHYQDAKVNDKRRCEAVERLSGMLGAYISMYNEAVECLRLNLQVQKTQDIAAVVNAVVGRILELKQQLRKLEGCQTHFLSQGLIQYKLTTDDAEFQDVPFKIERQEFVTVMIAESINRAKEKIKEKELERLRMQEEGEENMKVINWWDEEEEKEKKETGNNVKHIMFTQYEKTEEVTEEMLEMRKMLALIQAHERSRQVTRCQTSKHLKREIWTKELKGTLKPQASRDMKIRAAEIVRRMFRKFMELKRKKVEECETDKMLGLKMCGPTSYNERKKSKKIDEYRMAMFKKFDDEWKTQRAEVKENFLKRKRDEICEDYRDNIRDWFQIWYNQLKVFYDIPNDNKGGSALILRGEIPSPEEYHEQYEAYLEEKKKNKNKSTQQRKFEKQAAKREAMQLKKEQEMKKKLQEKLIKKIMKNPNMHPGYDFPESQKTNDIVKALEHYHNTWDELDADETTEVKIRHVKDLDVQNISMEVKLEVIPEVDMDMRKELKKLKVALKNDYENKGEEMPEGMKEKKQRGKKKKLLKANVCQPDTEKMELLAEKGILKDYPTTGKLEYFLGDHNLAGDRIRCLDDPAVPFPGEVRNIWWERCRELTLGFRKVLLVGPRGSGRTTLVHAMATTNDAVLFELDPAQFDEESTSQLEQVIGVVASCARAAQPALIYIRHVQRLFYKKNKKSPPADALLNAELIRKHLIRKLFKQIQKTDKVTIVGSCTEPWMAKTAKLLKQFPEVLLMPDTSYSVVMQLLTTWVSNNHSIPRELDVHSLAHMLRGYSFTFIMNVLQHFLEPVQIIRMAAHGLFAIDVVNYVMDTGTEKPEYEKYLKWYSDYTVWGKKEKKQLQDAREFKAALEKYKSMKKTPPKESQSV